MIANLIAMGRRFGMNRAIFYSLSSQAWMALAAPLTVLVIAKRLSPLEQGFYYTFSSVLSIQVFFELGLPTVVVQTASHEWASLQISESGAILGSPASISRLQGLAHLCLWWYGMAALLFSTALVFGGWWFLGANAAGAELEWHAPWVLLSVLTGAYLLLTPIISLVEGCNQVASVYRMRFLQASMSSAAIIVGLLSGIGLYALPLAAAIRFVIGFIWVRYRQRPFWNLVWRSKPGESKLDWRTEVWPFQWRIAVSWLAGYFIFSIFTPAMFRFFGPVVAGQMGMTLTLVGAIESVACAWLNTRGPQFGILIARGEHPALDALFNKSLRIALCIAVLAAAMLVLCLWLVNAYWPQYAQRVLPIGCVALFAMHRVLNVAVSGIAIVLRAHRQEPLVGVSIVNAVAIAACTYYLGRLYGPWGLAIGLAAVTAFWTLPTSIQVFRKKLRAWRCVIPPTA